MISYFINKSDIYIYIYSIFTSRTILHWGCMKIPGPFFSTLDSLPFISYTSVEVNLIFYLLSIWENVNLQEINLYLCYCCLLNSLSSSEPKTKDLCTLVERYCLSDGLLYVDQETKLFSLWLYFLSFSILYKVYFVNAFWWRVITASYFEFVCSGLLWYNLLMWLLDWIKKEMLTHSCVPVKTVIYNVRVCLVAWRRAWMWWCDGVVWGVLPQHSTWMFYSMVIVLDVSN